MGVKEKEEGIIKKVQKALKLSEGNKSESEAQNAMLLAQKLMAKHGLSMSDVETEQEQTNKKVQQGETEQTKAVWWQGQLARVIGDNFKCHYYLMKFGKRGQKVVFVGMDEDVKIAKNVFKFASKAVKFHSTKFVEKYKKQLEEEAGINFAEMQLDELEELLENNGHSVEWFKMKYPEERTYKMRVIMTIKKDMGLLPNTAGIKNDWIEGFIAGLEEQFKAQVENNDWGLVLVKDKAVDDFYENLNLKAGRASQINRGFNAQARNAGFEKGNSFSSPQGEIGK